MQIIAGGVEIECRECGGAGYCIVRGDQAVHCTCNGSGVEWVALDDFEPEELAEVMAQVNAA
jgi:hypothetical protein